MPSPTDSTLARHFISLATTIRRYETTLEKKRGDHFNLFEIIGIDHYEVITHSPILAELLNPEGTHGQGDVFLRLFLDQIAKPFASNFDTNGASVNREVGAGEYGRIDIMICDRAHRSRIIIENKINARLQDRQLERYLEAYPSAEILFLTLNGDQPSHQHPRLHCLSYRDHIAAWLEKCRKESTSVPVVRESITQYLQLVRSLTNQNPHDQMNPELLAAVTQSPESYLAYAGLRDADWEIRKALLSRANDQMKDYASKNGFELIEKLGFDGERYESYLFTTPQLKAANLGFGVVCDGSQYRDVEFGIRLLVLEKGTSLQTQIEIEFRASFGKFATTPWWPAYAMWDQHRHWNKETFSAIISNAFARDLEQLLSRLEAVASKAISVSPNLDVSDSISTSVTVA